MNSHRLTVPSSQKREDWFNFIKENLLYRDIKIDVLIVDFNIVAFLDTDDFVALACLIESFYINDCKVVFEGGTDNFNRHLYNIKFKDYWNDGFNREHFTVSRNNTTLCLWKISKEMTYSYSIHAKNYFEKFANNKDLLPIATNIDEVFNNIFDHSLSPITGYIITQYYPKNNKLSFSVCDFGIGIPTSINKYRQSNGETVIEDSKAIRKSLEQGFSVKSTKRNMGFGLNNILEFTESSNGLLSIVSNNGVVEKAANKSYIQKVTNYDFSGTLIKQ